MRNFWLNTTKHYGKVHLLEPSRDAKHRQRMIEWYEGRGRNAALTCRHFGISRDKFYRWLGRYRQSGLGGLEDGSHRPKRVRKPTWSRELEQAVLELRRLTPGWGKDKLVVLLRDQGWQCSTSMVGRILKRLKDSGRLVEAPRASLPAPVRCAQAKGIPGGPPGRHRAGGHRACLPLLRLQLQALHRLRRLHSLAGPGGT